MNELRAEKREAVLKCLIEGCSVRSTERLTGVHRDTVLRLMVRVGEACQRYMDQELRNLPCTRMEVDEVWCFVGKKQGSLTRFDDPKELGTFYVFIALDPETKLIPCWRLGKRTAVNTRAFVKDLAERVGDKLMLSSDAFTPYREAVERAFGGNVNYGQVSKYYGRYYKEDRKYSPAGPAFIDYRQVSGEIPLGMISTSLVERQNLQVRMCVRRLTRLTNAFSRKRSNLEAALALHFMAHNFIRRNRTTRLTPALAAGISSTLWTAKDLVMRFSN